MTQRPQQNVQPNILPRLSAPMAKLRKQWLTSVRELDAQAALAVLRQRLQDETDGAVRLGNIAAQSWIVRQRLIGLQAAIHGLPAALELEEAEADASAAPAASPAPLSNAAAAAPDTAEAVAPSQGPGWVKLRILLETEVNGMRFFAGSTIEVREEDARKLIEAKSAEALEPASAPGPAPAAKPKTKAAPKKA